MIPVLLALHRIGPYHDIRLSAAERLLNLQVLETRPDSQEYPWAIAPTGTYGRHQLTGAGDPEQDPANPELDRQIAALLDQLQPAVVVTTGWADRAYQRLIHQADRRGIPLVLISDSRERDEPRRWAKEWIKRLLLLSYAAALVAGSESRAYLERLGFAASAIVQPWDVVDNRGFAAGAARARRQPVPDHPVLARPHFLCVSRFVAKKNHAGLLAAYGAYQRQAWGLRLIGAGPLHAQIQAAVAQLPHPGRVLIDPFLQLELLQEAYGQAACFVLASHSDQWGLVVNEAMAAGLPVIVSRNCGCCLDLIEAGASGWSFDPAQPAALTALLQAAEAQSAQQRTSMVAAAHRKLEGFDPRSFAAALASAVALARTNTHHQHSRRRQGALLARLLSHQP
ncbi:glycosyltransferase [Synechococcus sp. CS-1324]|uniref:glycosyltransferase n=1 Tax=Synechococcus sp. CS-1324 TaxID=2847980 RepID=UPI00223BE45C|nr:glycosyltransferase [Synechococcus sp. CS-1324]MCT0229498.1 glycosyltransferase [Synechococcus sp. CS-1324]